MHVRQVPRVQPHPLPARIALRLLRPNPGIGLQVQHRYGARLQHGAALVHQQHCRCAVLQHVGQPPGRVRRVQRHVGASSFQNRQDPYHHLQAPLHANRHMRVRPHPSRNQIVRQPVGLPVQFAIGQGPAFIHHRDCFRRPLCLLLEQFMHACALGILRRLVPLHQQPRSLRGGQHLETSQRRRRGLLQRSRQRLQGRMHLRADLVRINR